MTAKPRSCPINDIEHVRKFVNYAKSRVNDAWYYPPANHYRYMAALALYSKCLTVAEAIIVLLEAGFSDEAFGMTRTLVDVFITLHYICNKDTEERAKFYCQFTAKDSEVWSKIAPDYWPHLAMPMDAETKKIAAQYPHPHQWSGKTVKDMALEPDTIETDPSTGKAVVHDFAYRVIFRWTSHYVHPTIVSLDNHLVQAGHDNFIVHGRHRKDMGFLTVFNLASFVVNTMICFHRCMGDSQPKRVANWGIALIGHLGRRHNRELLTP